MGQQSSTLDWYDGLPKLCKSKQRKRLKENQLSMCGKDESNSDNERENPGKRIVVVGKKVKENGDHRFLNSQ